MTATKPIYMNPAKAKTALRNSGLTRQAVADRSYITYQYLCRILRGKERPGRDTAERIASVLGVAVGEILEDAI